MEGQREDSVGEGYWTMKGIVCKHTLYLALLLCLEPRGTLDKERVGVLFIQPP
jgi:hypothetical protein